MSSLMRLAVLEFRFCVGKFHLRGPRRNEDGTICLLRSHVCDDLPVCRFRPNGHRTVQLAGRVSATSAECTSVVRTLWPICNVTTDQSTKSLRHKFTSIFLQVVHQWFSVSFLNV